MKSTTTTNQLILLLNIYRGTEHMGFMGTADTDVSSLKDNNLIIDEGSKLELTKLGIKYVEILKNTQLPNISPITLKKGIYYQAEIMSIVEDDESFYFTVMDHNDDELLIYVFTDLNELKNLTYDHVAMNTEFLTIGDSKKGYIKRSYAEVEENIVFWIYKDGKYYSALGSQIVNIKQY